MRYYHFLVPTGLFFLIASLTGCLESEDEADHSPAITTITVTAKNLDNATFTILVEATLLDEDNDLTKVEWHYEEPVILIGVGWMRMNFKSGVAGLSFWTGSDTRAMVSTGEVSSIWMMSRFRP